MTDVLIALATVVGALAVGVGLAVVVAALIVLPGWLQWKLRRPR